MKNSGRVLEILFRAVRGEEISVRKLSEDHEVSTKSISRDIAKIKDFLAENRDLTGYAELIYNNTTKAYHLVSNEFLSDSEMFAIAKVILGVRVFSEMDAVGLIGKFKRFTTSDDRKMLDEIVRKELYHYTEIKHDCDNVIGNLWQLVDALYNKREISIRYHSLDKAITEKRIQPTSLIFMEYYFYLIAYYPGQYDEPRYFRVDRITKVVEHRKVFDAEQIPNFDEGLLRKRCQFMFFGPLRKIRFSYNGPSVQAILDRLPTAKIVERRRNDYIIEAETHGDGIKLFLLSQGSWVKVIDPLEFVEEMKVEIDKMQLMYE